MTPASSAQWFVLAVGITVMAAAFAVAAWIADGIDEWIEGRDR